MDIFTIAYIFIALVITIYVYSKWKLSYWRRRGVEYLAPIFFYGKEKDFVQRFGFGDQLQDNYKTFKSRGLKFGGTFQFLAPVFLPVDLDLMKTIMQTNFNHFRNHGGYVNEAADPLTGNLFSLEDDKWKKLRAKLTPTFTSGKMKMMFHTLMACTSGMEEILQQHAKFQDPVDIKNIVSRFTIDVIGSVAFGIECNSLENPDAEFRKYGEKALATDFKTSVRFLMGAVIPREFLIKIGFRQTNSDVEKFFVDAVADTIRYRETNNVHRKDFMQLLLQLKNKGKVTNEDDSVPVGKIDEEFMTVNELAAQCFIFFTAGYETSATTMTFALLELALNPDIQDKLREEIKKALEKNDGILTYDELMGMTYLDKVMNETLRKHPPVAGMPRECNADFKIPGTEVVIEKGTTVHLPFLAIHRDPEYYPDPEKFDPERFNAENKAKRHPFAFLTFGEGPRVCIGSRFGLMQAKVGLTSILKNFNVTLHKKTKMPIEYDSANFFSAVKGDVWIQVSQL